MDQDQLPFVYYAAVVESSDDAFLGKTLDGVIQACNPAAERLFGWESHQMIGRPESMLIPPELQGHHEKILAQIRASERVEHFETVRVRQDGARIEVSVTVSPVRDASGQVIGASVIARDLTNRRVTEEAQAYLAAIVRSSDDAIISKDLNGIIRSCNEAAVRMFGHTEAELVGQPVTILLPEDCKFEEEQILARLRRGERVDHFETVRVSKDGHRIDVSLTISPIRNAAGIIVGASKIARDITERRQAEKQQREMTAERERLLASERAARADAEYANRTKDDFVAMVSHELRTPLNAIVGWTELLAQNLQDVSTLQRGLAIVARNARLQAQLISDLLDVSRIVSGKLALNIESVELSSVIEASIETVQHAADAKGIEIHPVLDTTMGLIVGDRARLQQIVWNLLSNAIKFTPRGGAVVVSLKRMHSHAQIVVSDNGEGISSELLPHIFERFSQADAPTTRRYGGLGLGLSIAKHLLELHGGVIRVFSEGVGRGTTFTINLPLTTTHAVSDTPMEALQEPGPRQESISLSNIRVLVVDDEADTRDLMKRLLETHHATVATAASASEALRLIESAHPDILVSDIGMPDVNGYELMRDIRLRADSLGRIPAIALTAFARSEDRAQALRAGYQAHVVKPVEPAELVMTIASLARLTERGHSSPL